MTVSTSSARKNTYTGNAVTTAFDFTFRIFASTDLVVTLRNTTTGVLTTKTITTHYTVSGTGNTTGSTDYTSGTVTMLTAPSASEQIIITSAIPAKQLVDYTENDSFPAASHEAALDKLTLLVQELAERSGRGISTDSVTADSVTTVLTGTPSAGDVIAVNSAGTGLEFTAATAASGVTPASTDTLTNKTIDADGTGNVITNIGSSEVKSELITGLTTATIVGADYVMISDTSASGALKKGLVSDITSASSGGMTLISTQTASASASLEWTGITTGYKGFRLIFKDLLQSDSATLTMTLGQGVGPDYTNALCAYMGYYQLVSNSTVNGQTGGVSADSMVLVSAGGFAHIFGGVVDFEDLSSALQVKPFRSIMSAAKSGDITEANARIAMINGFWLSTTAVTAIKLVPGSGTFTSGSVSLYGIN